MLMEIAHLLTRIQVMHFTVMQYSRIITEDAGIDLSRPPPPPPLLLCQQLFVCEVR